MVVDALVTPLLRVPLFQDLQPLHLARIAGVAERIIYRPGDLIIREGGAGDAAVLVVSGEAMRIDGPSDSDGEEPVPANALIGEMAMLIETEHTSTVVAKSQVRALKFPRAALNELMEHDPSLAEHFIDKLTGRLQELASELRRVDESLGGAASAGPTMRLALTADIAPAPGLH